MAIYTICASEAHGPNARTLDQAAELAAMTTDIGQIKVLLKQADGAMTAEDASMLGNLLKQSSSNLTPVNLTEWVGHLAKACAVFDV